jgi:riboflavin kinase/FMN adenylyltransferase
MQVIRNRPEWGGQPFSPVNSVVAIGNFDGVHLGHRALLDRCKSMAKPGELAAVVTFEPLPLAFFRPDNAPARLSTVFQKLGLLRSAGMDLTWQMRFDGKLAGLSAREFVEQVLVNKMQARAVVVGEDFRFGRGKGGDVRLLAELGDEYGFSTELVPAVMCKDERISSSGVRSKLATGDFESATAFLGRPFRMEGYVCRGAGLGKKLGYPTANLAIRARPSPLGGVLAAFSRTSGGPWLPAVTNLGRRPAVGGKEPLLEVHFFDFDEDLYGQRLEVQFVAKLRDELNFDTLEELVDQMKRDEHEARELLARAAAPTTHISDSE